MDDQYRTLLKLLDAQIQESHTQSFDVQDERNRNARYYSMKPLGNEIKGRSQYISPMLLTRLRQKRRCSVRHS